MWNVFKAGEIVDFAVNLELRGAALYQAVAARTRDGKVRETVSFLAAEEERHQEDFRRLLAGLPPLNPAESYPGEYLDYVQALMDSHVFTSSLDPAALAAGFHSDLEAIDFALGMERDSVLFYYELRNLVPKPAYATVDALIKQEHGHIKKLVRLRRELAGSNQDS